MAVMKRMRMTARTTLACGIAGVLIFSPLSPAMAKGDKKIGGSVSGKCTFNDYADPNYKTLDRSTTGNVSTNQSGVSTQDLGVSYVGNAANDRMSSWSMQCDLTRGSVVSIETGTSYSCVGPLVNGRVELFRDSNMNNKISPSYIAYTQFDFAKLASDSTRGQCKDHLNFGKPSLPPDQNDSASSWDFSLVPR